MANVVLTTYCNRSCPYCFAKKEMSESPAKSLMSWENLMYIADFLQASGQMGVSLLGGEPTIHPDFADFALYLLERGFSVTVFTNGIVAPSRLEEFRKSFSEVNSDLITFVCNLNDPVQTPPLRGEAARIERFLFAFGPWISPGFNIYRLDFRLEFLLDLINRYGMKRHLRLGIAHPVPGKSNGFIRPQDMRHVIERLCSYRSFFETARVVPGLDCGFPLCKFTDDELGWLFRSGSQPRFGCGPAVNISPDMSVYHCFPLSNYKRKSLFEFNSLHDLEDFFVKLQSEIKAEIPGIFKECDGCNHQSDGMCRGGGLCQVLNRFIGEAPVRLAEIENELCKYRLSV